MIVRDEKDDTKLGEGDKAYKFNQTVKFDFAYPKDFAKKKHMKEGVTELHILQAEDFAKRGFGKIVK
jgi:hypothetical protein